MTDEAVTCEVLDRASAPWVVPLPEPAQGVLTAPSLWKAILDPETKTKGQMIAVLSKALAQIGMFANECPQEVRDKINRMK